MKPLLDFLKDHDEDMKKRREGRWDGYKAALGGEELGDGGKTGSAGAGAKGPTPTPSKRSRTSRAVFPFVTFRPVVLERPFATPDGFGSTAAWVDLFRAKFLKTWSSVGGVLEVPGINPPTPVEVLASSVEVLEVW